MKRSICPQTYSKAPDRFGPSAPRHILHASGCIVGSDDGRDFVDYVAGLGPVILGHQDRHVDLAVRTQINNGICYPMASALEERLGELLAELVPGAEMVRYGKNGADVTAAAVRLARAVTGRDRVVSIGYHGFHDWTLADPALGVPRVVREQRYDCPWGDVPMDLSHMAPPACLIMEPVVATTPELPPPDYLQGCRDWCDRHGALLIYDEIVTGFRCALGGAQEAWNAPKPDLICLGKAMGNGYPISALVGKAEYMTRLQSGDVFFSTTFGGDCLGLAASIATLTKLRAERVPDVLRVRGERLMQGFRESAARHWLSDVATIIGYPQRPVIQWADKAMQMAFQESLIQQGFLMQGYFNLMLAHSDDVIAQTIGAVDKAMAEVAQTRKVAA